MALFQSHLENTYFKLVKTSRGTPFSFATCKVPPGCCSLHGASYLEAAHYSFTKTEDSERCFAQMQEQKHHISSPWPRLWCCVEFLGHRTTNPESGSFLPHFTELQLLQEFGVCRTEKI